MTLLSLLTSVQDTNFAKLNLNRRYHAKPPRLWGCAMWSLTRVLRSTQLYDSIPTLLRLPALHYGRYVSHVV